MKWKLLYINIEETRNCMPSRNKTVRTSRLTLKIIMVIVYGGRIKQGNKAGSVMIMIKSRKEVINVEYGKGKKKIDKCTDNDKIQRNPKYNNCICALAKQKI